MGNGFQQSNDGPGNVICGFLLDLVDQRQSGFTLSQRDNSLLVTFAHDGIEFPVTNTGTGLHNCRTLIDADAVNQLTPAAVAAITFASLLLATQVMVEVASL